jgi:hypothetical protein
MTGDKRHFFGDNTKMMKRITGNNRESGEHPEHVNF